MAKRVTIRKEGSHYVVSVNGRGMTLANTKKEAIRKQGRFQIQVHGKRMKAERYTANKKKFHITFSSEVALRHKKPEEIYMLPNGTYVYKRK